MINDKMKHSARLAAVAALVLMAAMVGVAQTPKPLAETATAVKTFTIEAIDYKARLITLKDASGRLDVAEAGPEIQRFNELKVGDKVTFRYSESVLVRIGAPGAATAAAAKEPTVVRETGPRPGGAVAQVVTVSVVITAIDPAVPSVTVRTADGSTMALRVENKKNLEGVKVGDRVEIGYMRSLAIRVESPK
jgi:Cu/Ag efflux protein CusF